MTCAELVPAWQGAHWVLLTAYWPSGHGAQEVPAPSADTVPAGQGWQALSIPSLKNWPAPQHLVTPSLSQCLDPLAQLVVSGQLPKLAV